MTEWARALRRRRTDGKILAKDFARSRTEGGA
jgi:hypothetical protein